MAETKPPDNHCAYAFLPGIRDNSNTGRLMERVVAAAGIAERTVDLDFCTVDSLVRRNEF